MKKSYMNIRIAETKVASDENGYMLIEILMAIAVLSIGLLALAALQTTSIFGATRANKHSIAILLAENQIEAYKNMPYNNIPASTVTETGTNLSAEMGTAMPSVAIYTRTTTVQAGLPVPGSTTITVTVSWQESIPRSVVLQTIIAQTGT